MRLMVRFALTFCVLVFIFICYCLIYKSTSYAETRDQENQNSGSLIYILFIHIYRMFCNKES